MGGMQRKRSFMSIVIALYLAGNGKVNKIRLRNRLRVRRVSGRIAQGESFRRRINPGPPPGKLVEAI